MRVNPVRDSQRQPSTVVLHSGDIRPQFASSRTIAGLAAFSNGVKEWLKKYTNEILDLVYPKTCFGCKTKLLSGSKIYLCRDCLEKIGELKSPFCISCGSPRPFDYSDLIEKYNLLEKDNVYYKCPQCTGYKYYFSRGYTSSLYDGLIRECIHGLKYNSHTYLGYTLAEIMLDFALKNIQLQCVDLIMPVPLHWKKYRDRGFNQSLILSRTLSKRTGIPLVNKGLVRVKSIPSQVKLSRKDRIHNLKGAFKVKEKECFADKNILLVDDVFTTGATMNECAKTLIESGAKEVWAFSLARGISC